MSVTIDEIRELEKRTQEIEQQKAQKQAERDQKRLEREKKKQRELWEKLVAPVLLLLSVLISLIIKLMS